MTVTPARLVPEVLARFDSTFFEFVTAFGEGQYVLWLGSGISRDRVPNVDELLERVLEHVRGNIIAGDHGGDFRAALEEMLKLASLSQEEATSIDFEVAVAEWPLRNRIVSSLRTSYSQVLDVPVGDGNPEDYLIWTALDVPKTYGAADLEPDVEHYAIAVLMLEGLVPSAVTANWDGLVEKALRELAPSFDSLVRVAVKPGDFRISGRRIDVIKFHGCAVLAADHESDYRGLLVGRESQISGWTAQPHNNLMRKHLETLYSNRPTLMIGLSAQDANLHTVFASAIQDLARPWPASPPAVVLSEEALESYHRVLLKLTYGQNYEGNLTPISESALLGAFAKPTLLALVLSTFSAKFSRLIGGVIGGSWDPTSLERLKADLLQLRNLAASVADPEGAHLLPHSEVVQFQREFTKGLINVVHFGLTIFRKGSMPAAARGRYEPLSEKPIAQSILNADFPAEQFGRLGVALALVSRGQASGQWSVVPGDSGAPDQGVVRLVSETRTARIHFVKDAVALSALELEDWFDVSDEDTVLIVSDEEPPVQTRTSRTRFGRDGKTAVGRFNLASTIADSSSDHELFEAFRLAGGF